VQSAQLDSPIRAFTPGRIGNLFIRNRVIRSGCFEGLCPGSTPGAALIEHHRQVAAGGVGMTTVSYCAVAREGAAFGHEMWMRPEIIPTLNQLTNAVHSEGAAVSIQLGHCGFFANRAVSGNTPIGPSRKLCLFRYSLCRPMRADDLQRVKVQFVQAARLAIEAGFDAIEIHAGHGYLLSQFLSPWTNHRQDLYGGSAEKRRSFPVEVLRAVRQAVGTDYPVLVKMNCNDGFQGGLEIAEAVEVARAFEEAGASLLIPSCGFTARTSFYMLRGQVPLREYLKSEKNPVTKAGIALFGNFLVKEFPYQDMFLWEPARRIRAAVKIPVAYIGGVTSLDHFEQASAAGFEFVQIGRATIRDPQFVNRLRSAEITASDCDHCNRCVAEMAGQGVRCVSREKGLRLKKWLPGTL
jgi:2,4-dienoyl-CoA reductase-like NADH-dependent reductase (Old Yellow Enzyme family)